MNTRNDTDGWFAYVPYEYQEEVAALIQAHNAAEQPPFANGQCQVEIETELALRVTELVRQSLVALERLKAAASWDVAESPIEIEAEFGRRVLSVVRTFDGPLEGLAHRVAMIAAEYKDHQLDGIIKPPIEFEGDGDIKRRALHGETTASTEAVLDAILGPPATEIGSHAPEFYETENGDWWVLCECGYEHGPFDSRGEAFDDHELHYASAQSDLNAYLLAEANGVIRDLGKRIEQRDQDNAWLVGCILAMASMETIVAAATALANSIETNAPDIESATACLVAVVGGCCPDCGWARSLCCCGVGA